MLEEVKITRELLFKNSFLNFIGQVVSIVISVVTIPYIIKGLGVERYGIFAIMQVIITYFNICELGLGPATTKFIAEALGKGEKERVAAIYRTSLLFITFMGIVGSFLCFMISSMLAETIFKVSSSLISEMRAVLQIASLLVFIILVKLVPIGVLEAYQRFDLINCVKIPLAIASAVIPAIVVFFGGSLITIIISLAIAEGMALLIYYAFSSCNIFHKFTLLKIEDFMHILAFAGWVNMNKVAGMIMLNIDKLVIGSLVAVKAVTYYAIPYTMSMKANMIAGSIAPVLFPAVSQLNEISKEKLIKLFNQSIKYTSIAIGLPILIFIVFAKEIIILWLGNSFEQSIIILQVLSIGMFLGGIAWILTTFLQGTGHAKLSSLTNLCQIPLYVLVIWIATKKFGVKGAAIGLTSLMSLSSVIFFVYCYKLGIYKPVTKISGRLAKAAVVIMFILSLNFLLKHFMHLSIIAAITNVLILVIGYVAATWYYLFDDEQKIIVSRYVKSMFLIKSNQ